MNNGGFDLGSIPPEALSGAISQLAAHPELISTVASILGKPTQQTEVSSETSSASSLDASDSPQFDFNSLMSSVAPVMAALGKGAKKDPRDEHRYALLCALKPYLNEERRQVLDKILQFGQVGDLLKNIK